MNDQHSPYIRARLGNQLHSFGSYNREEPVRSNNRILIGEERQLQSREPYIIITINSDTDSEMKEYVFDSHLCQVQVRNSGSTDCGVPPGSNTTYTCSKQTKELPIGRLRNPTQKCIIVMNDLVSRKHCKISVVDNDLSPLSPKLLNFLFCRKMVRQFQPRHPLARLSNNLVKLIFNYARSIHGYFICDEKSRNGTFVQVIGWRELVTNTMFTLAGDRYEMKVNQVWHRDASKPLTPELVAQLRKVYEEKKSRGYVFLQDSTTEFLAGNESLPPMPMLLESYIEITIKIQNLQTNYILFSRSEEFTMGIGAHIPLNDPAVPFNSAQSTVKYEKNKWFMRDGGTTRSLYGTWLKLPEEAPYKLGKDESLKLGNAVIVHFQIGTVF